MIRYNVHTLALILALFALPGESAALEQSEFVQKVATRLQIEEEEARKLVSGVFLEMKQQLSAGESIRVREFGLFSVKDRAPRTARNPRTGEPVSVPARRYARFRASDLLTDSLNKNRE